MTWVMLPSDTAFFASILVVGLSLVFLCCYPTSRVALMGLCANLTAFWSILLLMVFLAVAIADSLHFQPAYLGHTTGTSQSSQSLLDMTFGDRAKPQEVTFSAPFALYAYQKTLSQETGQMIYARLKHINPDVHTTTQWLKCVLIKVGVCLCLVGLLLFGLMRPWFKKLPCRHQYLCWAIVTVVLSLCWLAQDFHVLGTDKVGQDVFYVTVKSIRTGMVIGLVTTLVALPLSVGLGLIAGFKGGWLDDLIQFIYITISTIPGVLLITASVMSMQVLISRHPEWFGSLLMQADVQLVMLCLVLSLTGWTSLCRIVRAETLKLRETDYIKAARTLGTPAWRLLGEHIFPNLFHLVLISVVLDFSAAVLAEAVLSYVGVGVSQLSFSWGNMINSARLEFARDPVVWWPVFAAMVPMFVLVLSANLLSDKVRDVFDPRRGS